MGFRHKRRLDAIHAITVLHSKLHPYIRIDSYSYPFAFFSAFHSYLFLHLFLLPFGHVCLYYAILNSHFCVIIPENAFVSLCCCCKIHAAYNRRIKPERYETWRKWNNKGNVNENDDNGEKIAQKLGQCKTKKTMKSLSFRAFPRSLFPSFPILFLFVFQI